MSISGVGAANQLFSAMGLQRLSEQKPADQSATISARDEFLNYAKKTPAERMHAAALARRGMSEADFQALPPDEQKKLLEEIKKEIKEKVEREATGQKGALADIKV